MIAYDRTAALRMIECAPKSYEWSQALADQLRAAVALIDRMQPVVDAAEQWRSATCDRYQNCGDGYTYHDHDCPTVESVRVVCEAIDALRASKEPT
jgi:hypothetical protein